MKICTCGTSLNNLEVRCDRCSALRSLGLEGGATEHEIKAAFRMLVKVWHPDRFEGDASLYHAAQEKLKSINSAFQFLTSASAAVKARERSTSTGDRKSGRNDEAKQRNASTHSQPVTTSPQSRPMDQKRVALHMSSYNWERLLRYVAFAVAITFGKYFWNSRPSPKPSATSSQVGVTSGDEPRSRLSSLTQEGVSTSPAVQTQPNSASLHNHYQGEGPTSHKHLPPYFTVGSTKGEVLAIQGTPTAFSTDAFEYGASEVFFRDGRVVNWKNWPGLNPLRVKLLPTAPAAQKLAYFTVGSTKDEVLAVQGTPTAFSDNAFEYGASEVFFRDGKVVNWKNWPGLSPLRVRLR